MNSLAETLREGLDHHRAGRLVQAETIYRRVLKTNPRHAGAVHMLGLIAYELGNMDAAAQLVEQAMKFDALQASFPADLGEVYRAQGKLTEAIAAYRKALAMNPEMPEAHVNLGALLQQQADMAGAIECYTRALELDSKRGDAYRRLGTALQWQAQLDEARSAYGKAIHLEPNHAETYFHLGTCLHEQGELLDALACFRKSIQLNPGLAEAYYRCGLARLARGDFENGWIEFEWRLRCPWLMRRQTALPMWDGGDLQGRHILLHAERSLRDTLQFVRYLPLVAERGGTVVLDVQEPLKPLLAEAGWAAAIADAETAECDVQAPLSSLPRIFQTRAETIPGVVPYLKPSAPLVAQWRDRLRGYRGLRVGIAWHGSSANAWQRFRPIPLTEFEPLSHVAGVTLISLQKVDGLDQLAALGPRLGIVDLGAELDEASGAFMDTAAIIANVDLVIAPDTALAHLAGVLGAAVWVPLPAAADWRWMLDREDSPWYPTMHLFRQPQLGDWKSVFHRMAARLSEMVAARSGTTR